MYWNKKKWVSLMKKKAFDPKNTFWGLSQIKNGSQVKIEKRKTLFIMKFSIAYCPSVTVQSKKLSLCGTSKWLVLLDCPWSLHNQLEDKKPLFPLRRAGIESLHCIPVLMCWRRDLQIHWGNLFGGNWKL